MSEKLDPFSPQEEYEADPLAAAQGCLWGMFCGAVCWVIIVAVGIALLRLVRR